MFVDTLPAHVEAINSTGLRITGPILEDVVWADARLPSQVAGMHPLIFLCVKALHTETAIAALAPHLATNGVVVSAQNGLNEIAIERVVGRTRTVGCFVNFGADYQEPGLVQYSGRGSTVIGELDGALSTRIQGLHRLMQDFDPDVRLSQNIWGFLWGKLVYGALLFATALTNDSIADVLESPAARDVLTKLGQEIGSVALAERIVTEAFDGFDPAAFCPGALRQTIDGSFDDMVAHNRRSTKTHSGVWRDLAIRKRQTEVLAQLGPIVEIANRHGLQVPLTVRLISLIQEIEAGQRGLSNANLSALAKGGNREH